MVVVSVCGTIHPAAPHGCTEMVSETWRLYYVALKTISLDLSLVEYL